MSSRHAYSINGLRVSRAIIDINNLRLCIGLWQRNSCTSASGKLIDICVAIKRNVSGADIDSLTDLADRTMCI